MMGTKIRNFAPLPDLSLEELVPQDNFYRRLEATLDLSFVRDCYASSGRPSVDPVSTNPSRTTLASPASASAMAFGPSGASSSGSSSCAWRPDWCGARSSTSTLPRSRPTPL